MNQGSLLFYNPLLNLTIFLESESGNNSPSYALMIITLKNPRICRENILSIVQIHHLSIIKPISYRKGRLEGGPCDREKGIWIEPRAGRSALGMKEEMHGT